MRIVEQVIGLARDDEFDRGQMRSLMKQLEHRMLRIGADPAPGDRRGLLRHRLSFESHRLAVRFHFELLQIGRQKPQPLVIGEHRARLAAQAIGVNLVGEGREQADIVGAVGEAEMAVHLGGAFEQVGKGVPAQCERRGKADRRPERIAAADGFAERQNARFVDPPLHRALGLGGQRDETADRIFDARLVEPLQRRIGVEQGFGGGEGLRCDRDQRMLGAEFGEDFVERGAVDVRHHRDVISVAMTAERVDEQVGAERRSADADVEQVPDLAERPRFDRVDHHPHPLMQRLRDMHRFRRAVAAFGAMFRRPVLGWIGDAARKERLAPPREILCFGKTRQDRESRSVEMRLGEIEADVGDIAHQHLEPCFGIGRDQIGELLRLPVGKSLPGVGCGRHRLISSKGE